MDNALGIDVLLAAILVAGIFFGARRGLFRSVIGLVIVVIALVGAVFLADLALEPVTDLIMPAVEDAVVSRFAGSMDRAMGGDDTDALQNASEIMDEYEVFGTARRRIMEKLRESLADPFSSARTEAVNAFRSALSTTLRSVVRATVHTVLVLAIYLVLLLVLKLIAQACDYLLDAPGISTLNGLCGALLGFAEAAFLICVLLMITSRLGVTFFTDHEKDTYLLPFFLKQMPVDLINTLFHNP